MQLIKILITLVLILIIFEIIWIIYNVLYKKKSGEFYENKDNKTIWLLWFQGWDNAPKVVLDVKQSWIKWNPDWKVQTISDVELSTLLPGVMESLPANIKLAAKSDVVRLNLLDKYGGIWADATMLCMRPINQWITDALEPSGFWMYHGGSNAKRPASWFMVNQKGYIIKQWKSACDTYWVARTEAHDYFWMDSLFDNLIATDPEFVAQWERVPYIYCEDPGQSHALALKYSGKNPEIMDLIIKAPPIALKLTHHEGDFAEGTNAYIAIKYSLETSLNDLPPMNPKMPKT